MDNVIILNICVIFLVIFLVVSMLVIQKLNKMIEILERTVKDDERRKGTTARRTSHSEPVNTPSKKSTTIGKVAELPPEIIAPNLKKPPRPAGGFGSRVGDAQSDT
jgi:predicted Holliday junction resolvase-like endonuclease